MGYKECASSVTMSLEDALAEIDEKYNLSTCEEARELGRSVAHLRD